MTISERLRADDLLYNRGPDYEPLRVKPSAVRLEAAATIDALVAAAEKALHEMRHTVAPRNSFTDAVDALDAALTLAGESHD